MIRKLPPHLIQQIAAGEVIERPASVLKELIENALDAEATKIDICFRRGGLDFLSVEDNGQGIEESDIELALEPHATSKLSTVNDLEQIHTLGFRGEALAATAAVSDLVLETSSKNSPHGVLVRSSFGTMTPPTVVDKRVGTRISIKGLFQRVPARLKFLKSDRSESLALHQTFRRYALGYPEVTWTFTDETSKRKIQLPAASARERCLWFFASHEPSHWAEALIQSSDWKGRILFQRPRHLGSAQKGFQIFLNRRPLKDIKLEMALRRGFEGFTEFPREMSAALYLEGTPELFDVNVHPTKMEVRFLKPDPLFSAIVEALRTLLNQEHKEVFSAPSLSLEKAREIDRPIEGIMSASASVQSPSAQDLIAPEARPLFQAQSVFDYLFSIDHTYLVCRRGQELVLFDQHALHERILYQELLSRFEANQSLPSQRLLFPLKVSKTDLGGLIENEELLKKFGYEIRDWDENHIHLLSAPSILKRRQAEALIEMADVSSKGAENMLRDSLATMACHGAVRAHDVLSKEEIESLLSSFLSEDALGHCPHGRPTFVRLTLRDLEKMFHRVI